MALVVLGLLFGGLLVVLAQDVLLSSCRLNRCLADPAWCGCAGMLETLQVEFEPRQLELALGGAPVQALVNVQNGSKMVDRYTLQVTGLYEDWYTVDVGSVSLFPDDRGALSLTFHLPGQADLKAGSYPFRLTVQSRTTGLEQPLDGSLRVRGQDTWTLDIAPQRRAGRSGAQFRAQLANSGITDVPLAFAARDTEEGCRFTFSGGDTYVLKAHTTVEVPFVVEPIHRPWVGPDHGHCHPLSPAWRRVSKA